MSRVFLLLVSATALAHAANIKDCGSQAKVNLTDVVVTGCTSASNTCIFQKGKFASITLPFTPKFQSTTLSAKVHGIIGGIPIPFPLRQSNACLQSGLTCPLIADESYTYTAKLPVNEVYPSISLEVKWELVDGSNKSVVCLMIPVKIQ